MKKKMIFVLICLLASAILVACGPSQAERDAQATKIAADVFATQTAEAPTPTPTFTPTFTPTPTPTSTPTSTLTPTPSSTPTTTPTPTATPLPLPAGWRDHAASGFHIALPERWESLAIEEEGIEAILNSLEGINTEWARNITLMFSSEAIQEAMKFFAMDSEPAGIGFATVNATYQPLAFPIKVDDLCTIMPSVYEQLGVEMIEAECGLEINELDAARFTSRFQMGALAVKQYQYVYVQENSTWTLTLGVDETEWSAYEPIFVTIAESFRLD